MSIFGDQFLMNHIFILDSTQRYNKAQINKIAIERFLSRDDDVNTLIFLTDVQEQQLEAFVAKSVPRGRTYSFAKPLEISYPENRHSLTQQGITAVVTVAKRNKENERLYQAYTVKEGANYGENPIVTFCYGQIGRGDVKTYKIFHYSGVTYRCAPEVQSFSLNQYRGLNNTANDDEVWIKSLVD